MLKSYLHLSGYMSMVKVTGDQPGAVEASESWSSFFARYDMNLAYLCSTISYVVNANPETETTGFDVTVWLAFFCRVV